MVALACERMYAQDQRRISASVAASFVASTSTVNTGRSRLSTCGSRLGLGCVAKLTSSSSVVEGALQGSTHFCSPYDEVLLTPPPRQSAQRPIVRRSTCSQRDRRGGTLRWVATCYCGQRAAMVLCSMRTGSIVAREHRTPLVRWTGGGTEKQLVERELSSADSSSSTTARMVLEQVGRLQLTSTHDHWAHMFHLHGSRRSSARPSCTTRPSTSPTSTFQLFVSLSLAAMLFCATLSSSSMSFDASLPRVSRSSSSAASCASCESGSLGSSSTRSRLRSQLTLLSWWRRS